MSNRSPSLWSPDAAVRLAAAVSAGERRRRRVLAGAGGWPAGSTGSAGSANAWLLACSTKPPTWSEGLLTWQDLPPVLGRPHPGLFHPDPLGFWAEIRRWASQLVGAALPGAQPAGVLALTAVLHLGNDAARLEWARRVMRPQVLVFLDEAGWELADPRPTRLATYAMRDPHRVGQRYEGCWGIEADGTVVGKSPQHPAANRLYRAEDLTGFLASAPISHLALEALMLTSRPAPPAPAAAPAAGVEALPGRSLWGRAQHPLPLGLPLVGRS